MRSVLIPVTEIVKEIQLRVVVVGQLELVVPVVDWLAAPRHAPLSFTETGAHKIDKGERVGVGGTVPQAAGTTTLPS